MAAFDKVLSILTIPVKNSNISNENATDPYETWKNGDGQYLLPLLIGFTCIFCIICACFHSFIWCVYRCVERMREEENEEESGKRISTSSSEDVKAKSMESDRLMTPESVKTFESGTPRSRKSMGSAQNSSSNP